MSTLQSLTDDSFADLVLRAEGTVLVDFWAEWCGPCRHIQPMLEDLQVRYDGLVSMFAMNVDDNPATAESCGVSGLPTVHLYRDGTLIRQLVGPRTRAAFIAELDELVT